MPDRPSAQRWVPPDADLDRLRAAAQDCRGCELYEHATQTVFSSGEPNARVMLIGEQPGDQEDRRGEPFVGPAGRLLDRALEEAGIDLDDRYVTNAVKHFRFSRTGTGGRRLHKTPDVVHITACKPWLTAELAILDPEVIILLGATAGRALLGPDFRVTKQRGTLIPWPGRDDEDSARKSGFVVPTVHPSAVLRAEPREPAYEAFLADLKVAASALA